MVCLLGMNKQDIAVCLLIIFTPTLLWLTIPYFYQLASLLGLVGIIWTVYLSTQTLVHKILPPETVPPQYKAVFITGCDSGFGYELAKRLYNRGFTIFAGCLNAESEGATCLKEKDPSRIRVFQIDVTDDDSVKQAFKEVKDSLSDKELWAVVNNAGVASFGEIEWSDMTPLQHMFNVNVLGAIRVCQVFTSLIRKSQGHLVFTGSVAGRFTYPGFVGYSMTKHSILSLAYGIRREMRKWNVKVSLVEPGMYRTRMTNPEYLTESMSGSWKRSSKEIQDSYGDEYFEVFQKKWLQGASMARLNVSEVVDCLEAAVISRNPRFYYRCSGLLDKVRFWLMSKLPDVLLDHLMCLRTQPDPKILRQQSISIEEERSKN